MHTLKIENLNVTVENKKILNNFNLEIKSGEIHAIMGPNGTGKSTLLTITPHPLTLLFLHHPNPGKHYHPTLFPLFQHNPLLSAYAYKNNDDKYTVHNYTTNHQGNHKKLYV